MTKGPWEWKWKKECKGGSDRSGGCEGNGKSGVGSVFKQSDDPPPVHVEWGSNVAVVGDFLFLLKNGNNDLYARAREQKANF